MLTPVIIGLFAVTGCGNKPTTDGGSKTTAEKGGTKGKDSAVTGKTVTPRDSIDTGMKEVKYVAVTPDGKLAVAFGSEGDKTKVQLWDLQKKEKVGAFESKDEPVSVAPDGKLMARENEILDATTGKEVKTLPRSTEGGRYVNGHYFSPKWDAVVMKAGCEILIYDLTKEKKIRGWEADKEGATAVTLAVLWEGDKKVVSGHEDGSIKIWEFATGKLLQTLAGEHEKSSTPVRVAVSPDGKRIASADFKIKIWDLPSGKVVKTIDDRRPTVMWFLPDGKTLVYSDKEDVIAENLDTGAKLVMPGKLSKLTPVTALTPDGKVLATCSEGSGTLKVWDIQAP